MQSKGSEARNYLAACDCAWLRISRQASYHSRQMTTSTKKRADNYRLALKLMLAELGDMAFDVKFFKGIDALFDAILRTTWEEMLRDGCISRLGADQYRLTAEGWLTALEEGGAVSSTAFMTRLGKVLATLKAYVKPRMRTEIVSLSEIASKSGEPEGFIFNIIDSRASSTLNSGRIGAKWYERGRLVEIPVDFSIEPIDIAASFTVEHLEKIEELEQRLEEAERDRALFHCPHCDAEMVGGGDQDFPEYHCIVSYQTFACGMVTADGEEDTPCPCGPRWPKLDEFEFQTEQQGKQWICRAIPKTDRARRVHFVEERGYTKEEADAKARKRAGPKKRGEPLW